MNLFLESLTPANFPSIEEAEFTIGMVSDWLELDSPDEWIRSDSEIVRIDHVP